MDDDVVHGGPLLHVRPGAHTLVEAESGGRELRNKLVLQVAARGRSVLHVVCAQEPDTQGLVAAAREHGIQADVVLNASVIVRALTPEEVLRAVEEVVPHLVAGRNQLGAVVITDPVTPLCDRDVPAQLARAIAAQAASAVAALARRVHVPILVVQLSRDAAPALVRRFAERAGEHLVVRGGAADPERVLEFPNRSERIVVAGDRAAQARLEQFGPSTPAFGRSKA